MGKSNRTPSDLARAMQAEQDQQAEAEHAIVYHLTCNHFPPIPQTFAPDARRVIDLCAAGEYDAPVTMHNGVTRTAGELCEAMRLEDFILCEAV